MAETKPAETKPIKAAETKSTEETKTILVYVARIDFKAGIGEAIFNVTAGQDVPKELDDMIPELLAANLVE